MLKTYKIPVTAWDITFAEQKKSRFCMVAEALKRVYPSVRNVQIDTATVTFTDRELGKRLQFLTPPAVQMAILDFDDGNRVKPFIVDLSKPVVERALRSAKQANGKPRLKARGRRGVNLRKSLAVRKATGEDRFFGLRVIGKGLGEKKS
jgi:hypothetical protein